MFVLCYSSKLFNSQRAGYPRNGSAAVEGVAAVQDFYDHGRAIWGDQHAASWDCWAEDYPDPNSIVQVLTETENEKYREEWKKRAEGNPLPDSLDHMHYPGLVIID